MLVRARFLAQSSHPGPTLVVTVLAAVLGIAVGLSPGRIVLLAAAVFAGQLSIGWSNDWIDAARDRAVGRSDKPVARGDISVGVVRAAAIVAAAVTVPLSLALGPAAAAAHAVFVASGWAYNAGLKRTALSVLPFLVSFGLLPSVVTLAAPEPAVAAVWASAAGALFGVAVHFSNVLPDLADDAATGVAGLPHRMGARAAGTTAFGSLVAASLAATLGPAIGGPPPGPASLVGLVAVIVIAVWGCVLVATRPPGRVLFRLVILAALLVAAQLVLSGAQLSA